MSYLLLAFLAVILFVFYGLYAEKLDPRKPRILIPLILVGVLIVVAAILTQKPWWGEFLQALGSLVS